MRTDSNRRSKRQGVESLDLHVDNRSLNSRICTRFSGDSSRVKLNNEDWMCGANRACLCIGAANRPLVGGALMGFEIDLIAANYAEKRR